MILPVLDIHDYYRQRDVFVEKLRDACRDIGFVLLRHDLPPGLAERQLQAAQKFFELPLTEKMEIGYDKSPAFRGYMPVGVENTAGRTDRREQIEYATEYNDAEAGNDKDWPPYRRLMVACNPWPKPSNELDLQGISTEFTTHLTRIADCLRRALCAAIELDPDVLNADFHTPHWALKLACYPPVHDNASEDALGVGPHTDTNFLTLILQNDVGGLQVWYDERWWDLPPPGPDVLICNLGEQAEILSNGRLQATPHRVLANTTQHARISVPFFYNPSLHATIRPLPAAATTLSSALPPAQGDASSTVVWRPSANKMLSSVGDNTFKSLARSHPAAFAKHHPDLEVLDDGQVVIRQTRL